MKNQTIIEVTPTELVELLKSEIAGFITTAQNPTTNEPEILTRRAVAELFNVSLVCIHDWTNKGLLKPYKMGNRTYYKRSEVLEKVYNSNVS